MKSLSIAFVCLAAVLPFRAAAAGQDTICSFDWYSNTACHLHLDCIDRGWDGTARTVPSNVTSIAEDGLRLCLGGASGLSDADIVYIVDISMGMNIVGDPQGKRPQALLAGFEYQIQNLPASRAGYIGFAGDVVTQGWKGIYGDEAAADHLLAPVAAGTGATQLRAMAQVLQTHISANERLDGTNYRAALDQAIAWLSDPSHSPHPNKAIILFTDGLPHPGGPLTPAPTQEVLDALSPSEAQLAQLAQYGVAVHGVFLGDMSLCDLNPDRNCLTEGDLLKGVAERTGGAYYEVDPGATDTLAQVVRQIVEGITADYTLASLTVSNGTQTVRDRSAHQQDGVWFIETDQVLPLEPGRNTVSLDARFTSAVRDTTIAFAFHLDVAGDPDPVCVQCRPVTEILVLGIDNAPRQSLSFLDNSYKVRLVYWGFDTAPASVQVTMTTGRGDAETLTLLRVGAPDDYPVVYETVVGLTVGDDVTVVPGNNATEAGSSDQLTLSWSHHADPRDTAQRSVPVTTPRAATPVATPPTSTYYGQVIVTLTTATQGAVIYYTLDGTDPGPVPGGGGVLYTGPITLREVDPVVITARAYRETMEASDPMREVYTNADPFGPAIASAKYYLGTPPGATVPGDDTLIVTFTKPASCADLAQGASAVFRYVMGSNPDEGTVLVGTGIGGCSGFSTQAVMVLRTPGLVVPGRDSMAIRPTALSDSLGNRSADLPPVVIRYGRDYDMLLSAAPNPVDYIDRDPALFDRLRSLVRGGETLPDAFVLVKVISVDPVDIDTEKTWMTVYDALGNVVRDKVAAYPDVNDPQVFYFAWDLHTHSGRLVGTGSYLGMATIRPVGKGAVVRRQMIAVRTATGRQR